MKGTLIFHKGKMQSKRQQTKTIATPSTASYQNITAKERANMILHKYTEDKITFHFHSKQLQMQYLFVKISHICIH